MELTPTILAVYISTLISFLTFLILLVLAGVRSKLVKYMRPANRSTLLIVYGVATGLSILSMLPFILDETYTTYAKGGEAKPLFTVLPLALQQIWLIVSICLFIAALATVLPFLDRRRQALEEIRISQLPPLPVDPNNANPLEACGRFNACLDLPRPVADMLALEYFKWCQARHENGEVLTFSEAERIAPAVTNMMRLVPAVGLLRRGNMQLNELFLPHIKDAYDNDVHHSNLMNSVNMGEFWKVLQSVGVAYSLPTELRSSHHLIVAPTGGGKTTLFESMIVDDLKDDVALIVIDSHRDFLRDIAERVDPDRLVWIDPEFVVPALNLFDQGADDEISMGRALAMFDYIFASKGVVFTNNQARLYRSMSRLCMAIPGASLVTMREMCKPMGTIPYQSVIDTLDENTLSFFAEYHRTNHGMYGGTREEVLGRLQTALDSTTFAKMLGSKTLKLNILKEIEAGKVILVNTDSERLQTGASLLGRMFLGMTMQAVRSRQPGSGKQVYLYADEFGQDYAQDDDLLISMFTQLRKYRLGLVVVTQQLDLIPQKLYASISANTAIRMASDVSELDEKAVSNMLRTTVAELRALPKYTFMAYFRGIGTMPWRVDANRLTTLPKNSPTVMEEVRERMRREYGEEVTPKPAPIKTNAGEEFKEAF